MERQTYRVDGLNNTESHRHTAIYQGRSHRGHRQPPAPTGLVGTEAIICGWCSATPPSVHRTSLLLARISPSTDRISLHRDTGPNIELGGPDLAATPSAELTRPKTVHLDCSLKPWFACGSSTAVGIRQQDRVATVVVRYVTSRKLP